MCFYLRGDVFFCRSEFGPIELLTIGWLMLDSLVQRQKQWAQDEETRRASVPDPDLPPGHRLMPDDERRQTLERIKQSQFQEAQSKTVHHKGDHALVYTVSSKNCAKITLLLRAPDFIDFDNNILYILRFYIYILILSPISGHRFWSFLESCDNLDCLCFIV